MGGRPSRLTEIAPEPDVSVAGFSAQSVAGTLVVSGTQAGPTCQMLGRGKLIHVDPDFCNQVGSGDLLDSRNGEAQIDGLLVSAYMVLNADVQFCDLPFQGLQLLALQSQHPAVMRGHSSLQGKLHLRDLFAQAAAAKVGQLFAVLLAVKHLLQNLSSGYTEPVGGYRCDLYIGIFENLLHRKGN